MNVRLTLKMDKDVIEKAKIYAAEHKVSLSFIVENYLKAITIFEGKEIGSDIKTSEFAKNIAIGNGEIPADFDYKKDRQDYLFKKYMQLDSLRFEKPK